MTPYQTIYDSFLPKMLEDEWVNWSEDEVEEDLRTLLEGAIPYFKFPRKDLTRNDIGFQENLDNE